MMINKCIQKEGASASQRRPLNERGGCNQLGAVVDRTTGEGDGVGVAQVLVGVVLVSVVKVAVLVPGALPAGWQSMNLLNSSMSLWELVKPIPWPARMKYPRMSSAFQSGGFAFRNRIGTALLVSCR